MYTYNYNSYNKIEEFYSNYIKTELDKYTDNIIKLNKIKYKKIIIFGMYLVFNLYLIFNFPFIQI